MPVQGSIGGVATDAGQCGNGGLLPVANPCNANFMGSGATLAQGYWQQEYLLNIGPGPGKPAWVSRSTCPASRSRSTRPRNHAAHVRRHDGRSPWPSCRIATARTRHIAAPISPAEAARPIPRNVAYIPIVTGIGGDLPNAASTRKIGLYRRMSQNEGSHGARHAAGSIAWRPA